MTVASFALTDVPDDLFGRWGGRLLTGTPGCRLNSWSFYGSIEEGLWFEFQSSFDEFEWPVSGAPDDRPTNADIATRICKAWRWALMSAEVERREAERAGEAA